MIEEKSEGEKDPDKMWKCSACGTEFKPNPPDISCPKCKSNATFPIDYRDQIEDAHRRAMEKRQRERKLEKMEPERRYPERGEPQGANQEFSFWLGLGVGIGLMLIFSGLIVSGEMWSISNYIWHDGNRRLVQDNAGYTLLGFFIFGSGVLFFTYLKKKVEDEKFAKQT